MTTEHPFVKAKTQDGYRIIRLVESSRHDSEKFNWTREYLEENYVLTDDPKPDLFPYYTLKNG